MKSLIERIGVPEMVISVANIGSLLGIVRSWVFCYFGAGGNYMYVVGALNSSPCVRGFVKLWITLALSYCTVPSHRQILGLYRCLR